MSVLHIAYSGLQSASLGNSTTIHNISNANTEGYSRQTNHQKANYALSTGSGFMGQGSSVTTVRRAYNEFLDKQVNVSQSRYSYSQEYADCLSRIDDLLADSTTGLTPVLQEFFQAVQDVADNPSLAATRQAMVTSTQTMITRFQSLQDTINELEVEINGKISNSVEEINSICKEIGDLNNKINIVESSTYQQANDLRDQRDLLVNKLTEQISVTTLTDNKGRISVFTGSGQRLVSEVGEVTELTTVQSNNGSGRLNVGIVTHGGNTMELPDRLVTGGVLGGLVAFRKELDLATNELGRVAASMALVFNVQHAQGQDLLNQSNSDADAGKFIKDYFVIDDMQPRVNNYYTNQKDDVGNYKAVLTAKFTEPEYGPNVTDGNLYTMLTTHNYTVEVLEGNADPNAAKFKLIDDTSGQELEFTRDDGSKTKELTFEELNKLSRNYGFTLSFDDNNRKETTTGDKFYIQPTANAVNNLKLNDAIAADHRLVATALPFDTKQAETNKGSGIITQAKSTPVPVFTKQIFFNKDTGLYSSEIQLSFVAPNSLKVQTLVNNADGTTKTDKLPEGTEIYYREAGAKTESKLTVNANGKLVDKDGKELDGIPYSQNVSISLYGMGFSISGQPNNNDVFSIGNNDGAITDSRNILAIGELQNKNTVGGNTIRDENSANDRGTTTLQGAYSEMVALIGTRAQKMYIDADTQSTVLQNAIDNKQSLVGVNLDEEYVNMIKYQQAYQAASKCIETAQIMFDSIIASV